MLLKKITKIIDKYGLRPASKRELPLFTMDCVAIGYSQFAKFLGFSYKAMAAIGGNNKFHTLQNELYVGNETGKFLEKNYKKLDKEIFIPLAKIYKDIKIRINKIEMAAKNNPGEALRLICIIYPRYMIGIGIYNCFWRYLGNEKAKGRMTEKLVKKFQIKRVQFAKLYPQIEDKIKTASWKFGKEKGFDGDLLRYATLGELTAFLKNKDKSRLNWKELAKRKNKYFYLFVDKPRKTYIITDKSIIKKIEKIYFNVKENKSMLKGFSAYPGKIRGRVLNLENDEHNLKNRFVLVTSMTHPSDIALISKSAAIVTDEGGILSHATIVSRELKIPCIIGTKIATKVFKDGDLVEVDATKGIVRKIK